VLDQQRQILRPLAQRRDPEDDLAKPIVEVKGTLIRDRRSEP
jgi:hypothetical protein